jgi:hypothetical protein
LELSLSEILRYWSLLTSEQRATFIEVRAPQTTIDDEGAALVTHTRSAPEVETFFDRFAGIFVAFDALRRSVHDSLRELRESEADYRLFGQKYDSMGTLLRQVRANSHKDGRDLVDRYLMVLCARQLADEVRLAYPEFWRKHQQQAEGLREQLSVVDDLRAQLAPHQPGEMPDFLDWFERWFLKRAEPVQQEPT